MLGSLPVTKSGVCKKDVRTDGGTSGNLVTPATWDGSKCARKMRFDSIGKVPRGIGGAGDNAGHAAKSTSLC